MDVFELLQNGDTAGFKAALAAAERAFSGDGDGRVTERFELLHFAAWAPAGSTGQNG